MPGETNTSVEPINKNSCSVRPGDFTNEDFRVINFVFNEVMNHQLPISHPDSVPPIERPRRTNPIMAPTTCAAQDPPMLNSFQIQRSHTTPIGDAVDGFPKPIRRRNRILIGINIISLFLLGLICMGSAIFTKKILIAFILILCGGIFIGQSLSVLCFIKKIESNIEKISVINSIPVDSITMTGSLAGLNRL